MKASIHRHGRNEFRYFENSEKSGSNCTFARKRASTTLAVSTRRSVFLPHVCKKTGFRSMSEGITVSKVSISDALSYAGQSGISRTPTRGKFP
jgi:hypothetical protein